MAKIEMINGMWTVLHLVDHRETEYRAEGRTGPRTLDFSRRTPAREPPDAHPAGTEPGYALGHARHPAVRSAETDQTEHRRVYEDEDVLYPDRLQSPRHIMQSHMPMPPWW
jgi:hypothetical protein